MIMMMMIMIIIETVSELLEQYLSNTLGKNKIKELQKRPYWALHTYCAKC